jgi:hypothetical protein
MGRVLRHGVIAVVVAISGAVGVAPVQAAPARVQATSVVIDVANLVTSLFNAFRGGGMSIEEATRQIKAAIDQARTDIVAHMDRLATVEARSCASRHVIEFADIDRFTQDTLQAWAQNATGCVTLIDSLVGAVTDKAAIDTLGLAANVVGPIALIARTRAGFSIDGLRAVLASSNNKIIAALAPACIFRPGFGPPYYPTSSCEAYNGDRADCSFCNVDDNLKAQAMRNTGWVVAQRALPIYQG